jgi:2,3-dihydroxybenzoate-AMP ligase
VIPNTVPWPAEYQRRYRELGYWRQETFSEQLNEWASRWPQRTCVVSSSTRWTYSDLALKVARLASGLFQLGIRAEDRVVVQLPNVPEFIALSFALFRIGAVPVYALPGHRRSEIGYLCQFSAAVAYVIPSVRNRFDYRTLAAEVQASCPDLRHVLVAGDCGPFVALESLYSELTIDIPRPQPSAVALFQLSGGTTGLPKLIPRTHEEYGYSVRASAELCLLDGLSSYLAVLPIAHNFPMSSPGFLGTLSVGGKVVLSESASPDEVFPLIERENVTIAALVPPLALMWLDAAANGQPPVGLRLLQVGGAKLALEVARRVGPTLGCELQQVFGMAEGLVNYTRLDDPPEVILSTQGRPLSPDDELRIVDDEGCPVRPGETGHLLVRGPYTVRGYYDAVEHNAQAFTDDGFYKTGDVVRMTVGGNLVVEGREKDQINRGGDKVSAEELENHLLAHPGIRNVAAVAMIDDLLGERTCVFVVPAQADLRLQGLKKFLRERGIADFKLPDRLELVDELPRTAVGKISKRVLREQIQKKLDLERAR